MLELSIKLYYNCVLLNLQKEIFIGKSGTENRCGDWTNYLSIIVKRANTSENDFYFV